MSIWFEMASRTVILAQTLVPESESEESAMAVMLGFALTFSIIATIFLLVLVCRARRKEDMLRTEMRKTRESASESARDLDQLLRFSGDAVIFTEPGGRITRFNKKATELIRLPASAITGRLLDDVLKLQPPETEQAEPARLAELLPKNSADTSQDHEFDLIQKDGTCCRVAGNAVPLRNSSGNPAGMLLILRDVTAPRAHLEQLRVVNDILRETAEFANLNFFLFDLETGEFKPLIGESPKFLPKRDGVSLHLKDWILPEDFAKILSARNRILHREISQTTLSFRSNYDGVLRHFSITGKWLERARYFKGNPSCVGVIQEVTGLLETEARFDNTRALLDAMLECAPSPAYIKERRDGEIRCLSGNSRMARFFGIEKNQFPGKTTKQLLCYAPEQAEIIDKSDRTVFETGKPIEFSGEFRDASGNTRFFRISKFLFSPAHGQPLLFGFDTDITDLETANRAAEEARKKAETLAARLTGHAASANLLNHCLEIFAKPRSMDEVIREMMECFCRAVGSGRCRLFQYQEDGKWIRLRGEWAASEKWKVPDSDKVLPAAQELRAQFLAGHDILVSDTENPPQEFQSMRSAFLAFHVRAVMAAGIRVNGKLEGVCSFDFFEPKNQFSDLEIKMLHDMTNLFRLALWLQDSDAALAETNVIRRVILDSFPCPAVLVGPEGIPWYANEAARTAINGEVHSETWEALLRKEQTKSAWNPLRRLADEPCVELETEAGSLRLLLRAKGMRDAAGKLIGVLETAEERTDANLETSRSKTLGNELRKAALLLEGQRKSRTAFLAALGHEFRTPLNTVLGFSTRLRDQNPPEPARSEYLRSIHDGAAAMFRLIDYLQEYQDLDAHKVECRPEPVNIPNLIRNVLQPFQKEIAHKQLDFRMTLSDPFPEIMLDGRLLSRILNILLDLSTTVAPRGEIRLDLNFVADDTHPGIGTFILRLTDTGRELPPARKTSDSPLESGLASDLACGTPSLGLVLVRRILQLMNGTMEIQSDRESGNLATLILSRVHLADSDLRDGKADVEQSPPEELKVLLVDDVPGNLILQETMVRDLHYAVKSAETGKDALAILRLYRPDWILTDIWMPDMTGRELAAIVRRNPEFAAVRIAAVTADPEVADKTENSLFDAVLLKPVSVNSLQKLFSSVPPPEKTSKAYNL